jgi:hypothetical protein
VHTCSRLYEQPALVQWPSHLRLAVRHALKHNPCPSHVPFAKSAIRCGWSPTLPPVFNCSARHNNGRPNKTPHSPMTPATSSAGWSHGRLTGVEIQLCSPPESPQSHGPTFYSSNPSRVSARSVPRAWPPAESIPPASTNALFMTLFFLRQPASRWQMSPVVLNRSSPASLHSNPPPLLSIPIGPRACRTTGGFVLTALSNARRNAPALLHFFAKVHLQ